MRFNYRSVVKFDRELFHGPVEELIGIREEVLVDGRLSRDEDAEGVASSSARSSDLLTLHTAIKTGRILKSAITYQTGNSHWEAEHDNSIEHADVDAELQSVRGNDTE